MSRTDNLNELSQLVTDLSQFGVNFSKFRQSLTVELSARPTIEQANLAYANRVAFEENVAQQRMQKLHAELGIEV